jgi:hypothetical protein
MIAREAGFPSCPQRKTPPWRLGELVFAFVRFVFQD